MTHLNDEILEKKNGRVTSSPRGRRQRGEEREN